jgi:hypothetical protein
MKKTFHSKIDTWLIFLTAGIGGFILFISWRILQDPFPARWFLVIFLLIAGLAFPIALLFLTSYTITETMLIVKSGFFKWTIQIEDITNIEPTHDPLSSPALSLDRLRIDYRPGKSLMVSPKDKHGFLEALRYKPSPDA